ncbi:MAG: N-acetyltransferase, partial [Bacteroidales bacterium]|nr:N-acetyltransferase [Bacteroidales bacterium]
MHVTVKEVESPEELKIFYQFQNKLYRKCKVYVPTLDKDQENTLLYDPALRYCIRKLWLAYSDEGKVVGRIQGIINPRYNAFYSLRRVRFGWCDFEHD